MIIIIIIIINNNNDKAVEEGKDEHIQRKVSHKEH